MKRLWVTLPVLLVAVAYGMAQEEFEHSEFEHQAFDPLEARPLEPEVGDRPTYRVDPNRRGTPPVEFIPVAKHVEIGEDVQFERAIDAGLDDLPGVVDQLEGLEIDASGWEEYTDEKTRLDSWTRKITSIDAVDGEVEITVIGIPTFIQECQICITTAYTEEVFRLRGGKLVRIKHTPPRDGAGWIEL